MDSQNKILELYNDARKQLEYASYNEYLQRRAIAIGANLDIDSEMVINAWKAAWKDRVEDAKHKIEIRAKSITYYCYNNYVKLDGVLTEKEFDEVLKGCGLMRIPDAEPDSDGA